MKTLLIICTLLCLGYNQLNIDTEIVHIKGQTKRDYAKVLYPLLEKFYKEKRLTDDEIIKIIPTSEEEFGEYYSLSYPEKGKKWNKIYSEIEVIIGKRASINQQVFKSYLGLAPFVDGEYAEGYFEDADFLIGKHQKYFCKIFNGLPKNVKKLLAELYAQYCK